ncbi:MAG: TRAP transporter substrate-binding protein DctP [Aminobacteriaceae bacterium]|uniref:TRAP transporter substrate-binding protein n=1 Tax=Aminivibrio sp. TaxID=1872489 RepID=UPI002A1F8402|nr:TRAP transporter substrate-binding protein DctP [Synergistaceae bacterium]MDD3391249.1 TRAP transporter substrate-binding protein DctP [Synergistaceae bacterium]MDD4020382.1 TRAP transporter substrate-binding protein DctP [Synergistaceae bacterium]MDD4613693.1 TRAP transporter substrate-binding protein DctP [Synergistaceae bacterium]
MKYAKFVAIAAVLAFCLMVPAVSDAAREVKMSYNGPADAENNAVHLFAENFKKLVEEGTKGEVTVRLFPDSQLGNEEERMELLSKQGMNQPIINVASFAGVAPVFPEIYASAIPFMFNSYEAAHFFFDNSRFWNKSKEEFRKRTGAYLLEAVEEGGFLAFTNNKNEIKSPEDFKGLKFRGMDEGQIILYKSFGASGTPVPWTELYMALKTGVVDGQMNPAMYIKMGSLHEVQKYLTLANIQYSDQFLVVNGDFLDSLTPEQKTAVIEAGKKANALNRQAMAEQDKKDIDYLVEKGMIAYSPTPAEMDAFREAGQPAYVEWLKSKAGEDWLNLALECAKNANEKAK